MFRDRISGIAAAATLGTATLLGATNANAAIDLDAKDKSKPVVLFSSELVEPTGIDGVGDNAGKTWHQVTGIKNALDIQVKLGHRVLANDVIEVTFELSNMVFGTVAAAVENFALTGFKMANNPTLPTDLTGKSTATLVFTADTNPSEDAAIKWQVGNSPAGVFGVAPGGNGSITATITNLTVARSGGTAGHMASYPNAVQLGSSLSVGSTPGNLTADVADSFKSFTVGRFAARAGRVLTGNVGKVFAKLATPAPMSPKDGKPVAIDKILDITDDKSKVTLTGNFGDFLDAAAVRLDTAMGCASDPADATVAIADGKAGAVDFKELDAKTLDHYVCITVDGETPIPETAAYGAMVKLEQATDITQTLPSGTHPLGMIVRNGTTIRIPYITTYSEYNQRLVLVNRGGETRYEIEFMPEDGIMADPESMEGMLPAGTSMMLTRDIVTLTGGGTRTAASITVDAEPSMIDAATVTVNKMDGSTDTVTYTDN